MYKFTYSTELFSYLSSLENVDFTDEIDSVKFKLNGENWIIGKRDFSDKDKEAELAKFKEAVHGEFPIKFLYNPMEIYFDESSNDLKLFKEISTFESFIEWLFDNYEEIQPSEYKNTKIFNSFKDNNERLLKEIVELKIILQNNKLELQKVNGELYNVESKFKDAKSSLIDKSIELRNYYAIV